MRLKIQKFLERTAMGLAAFGLVVISSVASADEFGDNTPYYEDDAWYDVSEWFDGNDYNPTDEAIGRWDDETYDVADARTSTDEDNDVDWSSTSYGYYDSDDDQNNWYYDYYDYGYTDYGDYNRDGNFEYTARYYDYDDDGLYDAYAGYMDADGDGFFEDMDYYTFSATNDQDAESATSSREDARSQQKSQQAKLVSFNGSIKMAKTVKTPASTNLVVQLNDQSEGKSMLVDLGPAKALGDMPRIGTMVSVQGVAYKAGDKTVLLAQKVEGNGTSQQIDRSGREFTGTIEKTKKSTIRGQDHQLAKISTDQGKKLLVDLGSAKNLKLNLSEGSKLTVKGPAVKVNDRMMLIATSVESDGESMDLQRAATTK